jgi:hypothetical protein
MTARLAPCHKGGEGVTCAQVGACWQKNVSQAVKIVALLLLYSTSCPISFAKRHARLLFWTPKCPL